VTLPPDCARLATKPLPTGSATVAKTIGMVRVSSSSAAVVGVTAERMRSGCSATSSFAEGSKMNVPIGRCRLRRSVGETCGLTAVIAVTDKPKPVARAALQRAAAERGKSLPANSESRFRDQIRAVELLGGQLFDLKGIPFSAAKFPADRQLKLDGRMTMGEFLAQRGLPQCPDRLMVHAVRPKGDSKDLESHTFAVDRGWYFDNNVEGGRPVPVAQAREDLLNMRVIDVVVIRPPTGTPKKGC
jgi:hypothetical protein